MIWDTLRFTLTGEDEQILMYYYPNTYLEYCLLLKSSNSYGSRSHSPNRSDLTPHALQVDSCHPTQWQVYISIDAVTIYNIASHTMDINPVVTPSFLPVLLNAENQYM